MDCSPSGSCVHGISQARKNTGVGCHFLLLVLAIYVRLTFKWVSHLYLTTLNLMSELNTHVPTSRTRGENWETM